MYKKLEIIATAIFVFLLGAPLRAETVTASGVIEAVDVGARTVTVRRKTAKGEKTAKLAVGPKAEVIMPAPEELGGGTFEGLSRMQAVV